VGGKKEIIILSELIEKAFLTSFKISKSLLY
jgi:hypothetical protein